MTFPRDIEALIRKWRDAAKRNHRTAAMEKADPERRWAGETDAYRYEACADELEAALSASEQPVMTEDGVKRRLEMAEGVVDAVLIGRPDSAEVAARSYKRIWIKP